jgi:peptidyl-prolyl cis-trans isomerase C
MNSRRKQCIQWGPGLLGLMLGAMAGCSLWPGPPATRIEDTQPPPPPIVADGATSQTLAPGVAAPGDLAPTPAPIPVTRHDPLALSVNGITIHRSEFEELFREFLRQNPAFSEVERAREVFRAQLIDDLLLYDYGLRIGVDREADFLRRRERLVRQLLIEYVRRTRVLSQVRVTSEDIHRYYEKRIEEFTLPRQVQVRTIQTNSPREAEALLQLLREEPERFAELARQYSIHPSSNRGGELDPFTRDTYAQAFEEAAFNLEVGELSAVITTEQGYFLLEKTGEVPEQRQPLSEVQAVIRERLRIERELPVEEEFLRHLRGTAVIRSELFFIEP